MERELQYPVLRRPRPEVLEMETAHWSSCNRVEHAVMQALPPFQQAIHEIFVNMWLDSEAGRVRWLSP
jgi:hypothetical protein